MAHTRETRAFASEIKFVVEPALAERLRAWAREHLDPDPHGGGPHGDAYTTTSLYFDTPDLDVFVRNGSYGRAKYRVRRYADGRVVFLERKLRTKRLLAKRRTVVPLEDLAWLEAEARPGENWPGLWMARRLAARSLAPVCQVSYARMARMADTPSGPARLTLDDGIRATSVDGLGFSDAAGTPVLPDVQILELKFRTHLPGIFKQLVEEFRLEPQTASKYRLAMGSLGAAPAGAAASTMTEAGA